MTDTTPAPGALRLGPARIGAADILTNGQRPEDVRRIAKLDADWNRNVAARDLDALMAAYAENGIAFAQNQPPVHGKAALREYWAGLLALPGLAFDTADTHIVVSEGGDMAWVAGTYTLGFDGAEGRVEDAGTQVLIYHRIEGDWRLTLAIDNSNGPA